jgi:hypothetical protein
MKKLEILLGTALMAPFLIVSVSLAAPAAPVGSRTTGPMYPVYVQMQASVLAFQKGDDAAAVAALASPAIPWDAGSPRGDLEFGWRLYSVAQRLAGARDFAAARRAAALAMDHLNGQIVTAGGTAAQRAQAAELIGSLAEHVLNDRTSALKWYRAALDLDSSRRISAARIKALQPLAEPTGGSQAAPGASSN